jgi:hypothetical protein
MIHGLMATLGVAALHGQGVRRGRPDEGGFARIVTTLGQSQHPRLGDQTAWFSASSPPPYVESREVGAREVLQRRGTAAYRDPPAPLPGDVTLNTDYRAAATSQYAGAEARTSACITPSPTRGATCPP